MAAVNDTIKRALEKRGDYAYIAPFRSQAKAVAWDYLKHYSGPVRRDANESELLVRLVNRSTVRLFGADNADAMRGLGFDGVYMDEYGDFRPSVWGNVIRPTLSDRQGWAVFAGTPKGHNQFYDIYKVSQSAEWFGMCLRASESGILAPSELADAARQLTEDQYLQEYECSFEAAILGAYYGQEMLRVEREGRICDVLADASVPVNTAWDLGYRDDTAIWFYQHVLNEIHVIDYAVFSGASIETIAADVLRRRYNYETHWLPHDARAKTLASGGKSIVEQLGVYLGLGHLSIVPNLEVEDGIQAVRAMLPRAWFDRRRCQDGIEALRQYQREYDEDKKAFREKPRHDWTSHPADAFRMLAVAERRPEIADKPARGKTINEVTLDELYEWQEELQSRTRRI